MNRLMRAELYRFRHSGHYFWYVIFGTLFVAALPFISYIELLNQNLAVILGMEVDTVGTMGNTISADVSIMMIIMILPPVIGVISGQLYNKGKLGYYEIMTGNKPSQIILSKVFTIGLIFFALTSFALLGFYVYIGVANGTGSVANPAGKMILEMILIAQMTICSVMIMMVMKKPGAAGVICYVRFLLFDSMGLPFLMWLANKMELPELAEQFAYMSIMNKMQMVLHANIHRMLVLHVVFGFIAEFIIWYYVIYRSLVKKNID